MNLSCLFACAAITAGCASTQVNENTLDISSTYDKLITRQVDFNLVKTLKDPFGIPAFSKITIQSAQTTNSITPTFTVPFSSQVTNLLQQALAPTGLTTTTAKTLTLAGAGLSLAAQDQWNQGYTITPVIDPDQLRRLRLLFQYATQTIPGVKYHRNGTEKEQMQGQSDANDRFEYTYPLIQAASPSGGTTTEYSATIDGKTVSLRQSTQAASPKKQYVRRSVKLDPETGEVTQRTWTRVTPDATFINLPGCVMCDYSHNLTQEELGKTEDAYILKHYKDLTKLEKNYDLSQTWLVLPGDTVPKDPVSLPSSLFGRLYARDKAASLYYYYEFVIFCIEASSQGTGSPSSGGQSEGRKTATPQILETPPGGVISAP